MHQDMYYELLEKAQDGDPKSIFDLALLCRTGTIESRSPDEDIVWLKHFFETEIIQSILADLEDDNIVAIPCGVFDELELYPLIIEAGITLGLYYRYSSRIDDLSLAENAFYYAWLASKQDYIEVDDEDSSIDLLSLMRDIETRKTALTGGENTNE